MTPMRVLIIEDEPIIAQDIAMMLRKEAYEIVDIAMDYHSGHKAIMEQNFDIVLVDINLESEKSGIDLAEIIRDEIDVPFLYLTSYSDEDTLKKILPTKPSGYLIKPIKFSDLRNSMELAFYNHTHQTDIDQSLKKDNIDTVDHFYIKEKRNYTKISKSEILFAKAYDNYSYIFTGKKKYLVSETLKVIESKLDTPNFKRIHRSYVINVDKIESIKDNGVVIHEHLIPISKSHKTDFFKGLNIF